MAGNVTADVNPLAPKQPHFDPKAKACIFIFMAGAPSHIDLFDDKPMLKERHGQPLPDSMLEKVRFAFIKKDNALLQGSPYQVPPARRVRDGIWVNCCRTWEPSRTTCCWSVRCTPISSIIIPVNC